MQFDSLKTIIPKTLKTDLQELKDKISQGLTQPQQFLNHLHQIALMRTSSEKEKILTFAPHLESKFSLTEVPERPPSAITSKKDTKNDPKQPSSSNSTMKFEPKNQILEHENAVQNNLDIVIAAARVYEQCAYIYAYCEKDLEITKEILQIGFRGGCVSWSQSQEIHFLQIQTLQKLLLRILRSLKFADNSLWLVTLERAESFQNKKKPNDGIKHIIDIQLKESYSHALNCFSVFLAEFMHLYITCENKLVMQPTFMNLGHVISENLYMLAMCCGSVGFLVPESLISTLKDYFKQYLAVISNMKSEFIALTNNLKVIGSAISSSNSSEEVLVLCQNILKLKQLPASTEYISSFYNKQLECIQVKVLGYIEVSLRLQLIIQRFNTLSQIQEVDTESFNYFNKNSGALSIDFELSAQSLNLLEVQPNRFVKKDDNQGYLEIFSTIPYQVKLTTSEQTDFDYLVVKKQLKNQQVVQDQFKSIQEYFAVLCDVQQHILFNAPIFKVDIAGKQLSFYQQILIIFEQIFPLFLISSQITDTKGKAPEKSKVIDQVQEEQKFIFSNIIEQFAIQETSIISSQYFQIFSQFPLLQLYSQIAFAQFMFKFNLFIEKNQLNKNTNIIYNSTIDCFKILKWQFSESKEKGKNVQEVVQTADVLIQQSSIQVTQYLLLVLTNQINQLIFEDIELKPSQTTFLATTLANIRLIFIEIKSNNAFLFNSNQFTILKTEIFLDIWEFLNMLKTQIEEPNNILILILGKVNDAYLLLGQSNFQNEYTQRQQLDITNLIINLVQYSQKYFSPQIGKQLIQFYTTDSNFSFTPPTNDIQSSTLRDRLLTQSLQKSILKEATMKQQKSGSKRLQQITTMTSYSIWRSQFIHLLIQNLIKQNYYENIYDITFISKDRTFIYNSQTLLNYSLYSIIQLQKYDKIIDLVNFAVLPEQQFYEFAQQALNYLFSINVTFQNQQINYAIEFVVQQVNDRLLETPSEQMQQYILDAQINYFYQTKDFNSAINIIKEKVDMNIVFSEERLLELLIIAVQDSVSQQTFDILTNKYFKEIIQIDESYFEQLLQQFKKINFNPIINSLSPNFVLQMKLMNLLMDREMPSLVFTFYQQIITSLISVQLDFEQLSEFLNITLQFLNYAQANNNCYMKPLFLQAIQSSITSQSLLGFDKFMSIYNQKTTQFNLKIRQIQRKFLDFAIESTISGFTQIGQLFSQSIIGSEIIEEDLINNNLQNFYNTNNSDFVQFNLSYYIQMCYLPKKTLKYLISFVLGQFIQGYDEIQEMNIFINKIFNRASIKLISSSFQNKLYKNIDLVTSFMEFDDKCISLILKLMTCFNIVTNNLNWYLDEVLSKIPTNDNLYGVAQQCKLIIYSIKVYCNQSTSENQINVIEQTQFQNIICKYMILSHIECQYQFLTDNYVQLQLIQQQNFINILPLEEDLINLYDQMKIISAGYDRGSYYLVGLIMLVAPHFVLQLILQDQTLPRVISLQTLVYGRRLLLSRIVFEKMLIDSTNYEERFISLLLAQINERIIYVVLTQPEALADTYFSSLQQQDLLVTKWLAQTTESEQITLQQILVEPCSYNINSVDLIENVLSYLIDSQQLYYKESIKEQQDQLQTEIPDQDKNKFETLIDSLKNIGLKFSLGEQNQIQYSQVIQLQKSSPVISSKGKEPTTTHTTYQLQFSYNIVALQVFLGLLHHTIVGIFELSKQLNETPLNLSKQLQILTPYICQILFRKNSDDILPQEQVNQLDQITYDMVEQIFDLSELSVVNIFIQTANIIVNVVKNQQVYLVRVLSQIIAFRDNMIDQYTGLDQANLFGINCLQQNQLLLDIQNLVNAQPQDMSYLNMTSQYYFIDEDPERPLNILGKFQGGSDQQQEKGKKVSKEPESQSIQFSTIFVKGYENISKLIQQSLTTRLNSLQNTLSLLLSPLFTKQQQIQNLFSITSFPQFGFYRQVGSPPSRSNQISYLYNTQLLLVRIYKVSELRSNQSWPKIGGVLILMHWNKLNNKQQIQHVKIKWKYRLNLIISIKRLYQILFANLVIQRIKVIFLFYFRRIENNITINLNNIILNPLRSLKIILSKFLKNQIRFSILIISIRQIILQEIVYIL